MRVNCDSLVLFLESNECARNNGGNSPLRNRSPLSGSKALHKEGQEDKREGVSDYDRQARLERGKEMDIKRYWEAKQFAPLPKGKDGIMIISDTMERSLSKKWGAALKLDCLHVIWVRRRNSSGNLERPRRVVSRPLGRVGGQKRQSSTPHPSGSSITGGNKHGRSRCIPSNCFSAHSNTWLSSVAVSRNRDGS
jgi:hypothetical protein